MSESRRGRRPLPIGEKAGETLHIRLSDTAYDAICRVALETDTPVNKVARKILERESERLRVLST